MATRTLNKLVHVHVVVGLSRATNKQYLTGAKAIVVAMTDNPSFAEPIPLLAMVQINIEALDRAETAARTRGAGLAAARDVARLTLAQSLEHLRDHVQGVCNASVTDGIAIAQSAGMRAKRVRGPGTVPQLSVEDGPVSGSVALRARSLGVTAVYYWQYSADGGETWLGLPDTMKARTGLAGLVPGQTYLFRFRGLTRKGPVDHSQVVSHMVV